MTIFLSQVGPPTDTQRVMGAEHSGMALGPLLVQLRQDRGFTQEALAVAANVSLGTIASVEQGHKRRWYPANSRRVFKILMESAPLTQAEAYQFLDAVGQPRTLYHTVLDEVEASRAARTGTDRSMLPNRAPPELNDEAHVLLEQLKSAVGVDQTVILLRTILLTEAARRKPAPGTLLNVRHPPQQSQSVPGAIEQRVTHYEAVEPEPVTTSKPRARKLH